MSVDDIEFDEVFFRKELVKLNNYLFENPNKPKKSFLFPIMNRLIHDLSIIINHETGDFLKSIH